MTVGTVGAASIRESLRARSAAAALHVAQRLRVPDARALPREERREVLRLARSGYPQTAAWVLDDLLARGQA